MKISFPFKKCPICHKYSVRLKAHMTHKHYRIGLSEDAIIKEYEKLKEKLKEQEVK
jgi:hypothetical protein